MFSIRKIFAKKENMESNIAIKREINQGGSGKLKMLRNQRFLAPTTLVSEPPRKKLGDGIVLPTRKINPMEKDIIVHKKMQELQNKIIGQRNNIALAKGVVPDPRKRQFIKKGVMGIIAGVGIAIFSKMTRGIQSVNFNDGTTAFDLQTAGNVSKPNQPGVLAYNSATDSNVTGADATTTIDFDTEVFDQNADFATDTFTAPVTGRYFVAYRVAVLGVTSAGDSSTLILITSNRNSSAQNHAWNLRDVGDVVYSLTGSQIIDMDASDTFTITLQSGGESTNVQDIQGAATLLTSVSAWLVG